MAKIFVISDTHFPFQNKKALKDMLSLIKKEKPTHVIQVGDLLDQYVFSKYPRKLEITPETEIREGLEQASSMWKAIRKTAPRARCYQLLGNHDLRMSKRIAENLPELMDIVDYRKLYSFPGVKTMRSDRSYLKLDGVFYIHGHLSKSIDHARKMGGPVVHGHRHRMTIETEGKLWSMDVGFLGDERQLPFQYTQSTITNWTLGCGIVEDGKPRLVFL